MNADDEQLLRGRVYGQDHDHPNPGPLPHQTYAVLVGGPLDGLLLDITGWRPEEIEDGVALMTELGGGPVAARSTTRAQATPACPARVSAAVSTAPATRPEPQVGPDAPCAERTGAEDCGLIAWSFGVRRRMSA